MKMYDEKNFRPSAITCLIFSIISFLALTYCDALMVSIIGAEDVGGIIVLAFLLPLLLGILCACLFTAIIPFVVSISNKRRSARNSVKNLSTATIVISIFNTLSLVLVAGAIIFLLVNNAAA